MIGIISDTHDNLKAVEKAVDRLNSLDLEMIIHAGDFIAPFTAIALKRLNAKLVGVFGNNDGEIAGLLKELPELTNLAEFEHNKKKFVVYHGTIKSFVDALVKSRKYDVVITGHTHAPHVKEEGGVLLINPGALSGYSAEKRTFCILNLESMRAEIKEL